VELLGIEGNILHFDGADIIDGTPLLDIKPYTAKFDLHNVKKSGWQDDVDQKTTEKRGKRGYKS
jgi:tRNA (Thr-GGU) A37 N-methylase